MPFSEPVSEIITQTGRDTDFTGLVGNSGVTVTQDTGGVTYYDFGTNRLLVEGTVFHDPEKEVLIFHHSTTLQTQPTQRVIRIEKGNFGALWVNITSWSRDVDGNLSFTKTAHGLLEGDAMRLRLTDVPALSSSSLTYRVKSATTDTVTLENTEHIDVPTTPGQYHPKACYNYGREITSTRNKTRTSRGTGLYFTGSVSTNWRPDQAAISSIFGSGYFWCRGGTIVSSRPFTFQSTVDIKDTVFINPGTNYSTVEIRDLGSGVATNMGCIGFDVGNYNNLRTAGFNLQNGTLIETLGEYYTVSLENFDTTNNVSDSDLGADCIATTSSHRYYKLYNPVLGSNVVAMWRATRQSIGQIQALETLRTVNPKLVDTGGTGVENAKIYLEDTPSPYAKKGYLPNGLELFKQNGIVKITNATPPVASFLKPHGLSTGDVIAIHGFISTGGVTNADPVNGRRKVTVIDTENVSLQDTDGNDVVGQQLFDAYTGNITNIDLHFFDGANRIRLTVDTTSGISTSDSTLYLQGIVGGSSLEALNNTIVDILNVTPTTITLSNSWPGSNNSYTSGGTYEKVYYRSYNTTTEYDYLSARTYEHTTDANGEVTPFDIITSVQLKEWGTNEAAALIQYGGTYDMDYNSANPTWRNKGTTDNPAYSDWDTANFDNFYRVDRRGVGNTSLDNFTFNFCKYEKALSQYTTSLVGANTLNFNWILFDDTSITETNKGTVDAYTTIDNPEEFYDRAKSFLYDNYAGETSTIVSRSGNTINAGSYNITVDANAANVFAFDGTTITIKATQFIGNITSSGTFSLLNDAEILGTYGAETVLPWTVTNVEAGSTIQLFNVTGDNEIKNYITAGSGTKITATGSYGTADAEVGDTIRLRVTCQVGLEALEPFETFGVATAAGIAFRADQVADAVYNANNIDGSLITGITLTPDYTNVPYIQIDVDDQSAPYEVSAQQIYNFYAYIITTPLGIANLYGAISPIDRMNYRINTSVVDLKIQNTGTTDVVINGGRLYRDDNVSIIDTNPATGAGTGSLVHDTGFLLQYIQPQVEAAVTSLAKDSDMQTVKTDVANIKKKANLIPGLL